jgi:hypothetical protein
VSGLAPRLPCAAASVARHPGKAEDEQRQGRGFWHRWHLCGRDLAARDVVIAPVRSPVVSFKVTDRKGADADVRPEREITSKQ